jgi:predicted nucleic acid-binding Zn ribbon protein
VEYSGRKVVKSGRYRITIKVPGVRPRMPGVYRLKKCPKCGTEHRKRGDFCTQSCASRYNSERTDEQRQKQSEAMKEYYRTPEGVAKKAFVGLHNSDPNTVTIEDFAINIPDIPELPEGYDIADKW